MNFVEYIENSLGYSLTKWQKNVALQFQEYIESGNPIKITMCKGLGRSYYMRILERSYLLWKTGTNMNLNSDI